MSGPAELAIAAGILADSALKATVVVGLGGFFSRVLRHQPAATRHALWATTLLCLPLLPVLASSRGAQLAVDLPWVVGVWFCGVVCASLPLLWGLFRLHRIRRAARPDPRQPGVIHSSSVRSPLTWGVFRPVIALPTSAQTWPIEHLDAALAHENAHISRGDWIVHLSAWCVCALFWFHPLVWWARRELCREAEHAADDAVLRQGVRPSDYASLLVSLAGPVPTAGLGVAPSMVSTRVHRVLDSRSRSPRRWPVVFICLVLVGFTLPSLAAWPPWPPPPVESLTCSPGPTP